MICIGVDGGGSKTALAAYENGTLLAAARVGAMNYNFIGVDAAVAHLIEGVHALGVPTDRIAAIGIGDPSIDDGVPLGENTPTARFLAAVQRALGVPVYLRSDAYMTLFGLTGGCESAVLMLSGTGAMGIAENAAGRIAVAGGWGRLTGDEGSGYYLATAGIRAALQAADGIAPKTLLTDAALRHFGVSSPRELIGVFYGEDEVDIAAFATAVDACARAGDEVAHGILLRAAHYLAAYAARLLDWSGATRLGVFGSVLCQCTIVRDEFERLIREHAPAVQICEPSVLPERAAADYAKKLYEQGGHA